MKYLHAKRCRNIFSTPNENRSFIYFAPSMCGLLWARGFVRKDD